MFELGRCIHVSGQAHWQADVLFQHAAPLAILAWRVSHSGVISAPNDTDECANEHSLSSGITGVDYAARARIPDGRRAFAGNIAVAESAASGQAVKY